MGWYLLACLTVLAVVVVLSLAYFRDICPKCHTRLSGFGKFMLVEVIESDEFSSLISYTKQCASCGHTIVWGTKRVHGADGFPRDSPA